MPDSHGQTFHPTKSEEKLDGKLNAKKLDAITIAPCDIVILRGLQYRKLAVRTQKIISELPSVEHSLD